MAGNTKRSTTVRDRARAKLTRQRAACGICGEPIDYKLPHTDPRSFVADHVAPLHRGGDDQLDNFQAAHRDCNSKKRARVVAPIVRRSSSLD